MTDQCSAKQLNSKKSKGSTRGVVMLCHIVKPSNDKNPARKFLAGFFTHTTSLLYSSWHRGKPVELPFHAANGLPVFEFHGNLSRGREGGNSIGLSAEEPLIFTTFQLHQAGEEIAIVVDGTYLSCSRAAEHAATGSVGSVSRSDSDHRHCDEKQEKLTHGTILLKSYGFS